MAKKNDYNYFDAFVSQSNYSYKLATILHDTLSHYSSRKLTEKIKEAREIEHQADLVRHDIMNRLIKEFLPPIDREDITTLSQEIDDVTDSLEDVFIHIDMYHLKATRPELLQITESITTCIKAMIEVLEELKSVRNSKKLYDRIIEVNRLKELGIGICFNTIHKFYQSLKEPIELMYWTDVVHRLETCFKHIEQVANIVERIVMKNS